VEGINLMDKNTIILMENSCISNVIKTKEPFVETFMLVK